MGRNAPIIVRFVLTFLVVFGTFNPSGVSWWGWVADTAYRSPFYTDPVFFGQALCAIIIVGVWAIFVRISLASLRGWGILLVAAGFALGFGFLWSLKLAAFDDHTKLTWSIETAVWLILFIGSSAPQIYRWLMSVFTNQPIHHGDVGHHH